jgi:hypothetical protein
MYAPSPGLDPFFLVQYTSLGTLLDHLALTSGGDDNSGIASDDSGNIYLCGDYYYYDPFVIGNDSLHFYNGESENLFVAKYKPTTICNIPETVNVTTNNLIATLYPNPATNTLTIQHPNSNKASAGIYDITGRLMGSYPLTGNTTTISVQNLPPGIYQCRIIEGERNVTTKKVVIMH